MRLTYALFWLGLTVWIAAAIAPGAAAASVFMTLPRENIAVVGHEDFFAGDAPAAGRYIAGRAIYPLFAISDWVQMAAAALCVSTSIRWWRLGQSQPPRWMAGAAVLVVLAASAVFAVHLWHTNGLRQDLGAYWQAIDDKSHEAAATAKAQFDASHRVAERLNSVQIALLLTAVAATACAHAPRIRGLDEAQ